MYKTGFEVIREQLFVISPSLSHRFYFPAEKKAFFRILGHFGFFVTLRDPWGPLGGIGVSASPYPSVHLLPQKMGTTDKSVHHWVCTGYTNTFFRILGHF